MWKNSSKTKDLETVIKDSLWYNLLFLVVAASFLLIGSSKIWDYLLSGNWSATEAVILAYEIEYDGEGLSRPRVEYTFYFENQQYYGHRHSFGGEIYTNVRSQKMYEAGQTVQIYFNPSNPRDNILNREVDSSAPVFMGMGLLFVFVSLFNLLFSRKAPKEVIALPITNNISEQHNNPDK